MKDQDRISLEGVIGDGGNLDADGHAEILAEGRQRFPEESYQQLLEAGASPEEALKMLGYSKQRLPLHPQGPQSPRREG